MPIATLGPMERRSQTERSAATRALLLDATIDCLAELGWAATSTTEVARRAGVSRGAQVHHYPTKDDLVLAAMEHVIDRRLAEYREAFRRMAPDERTRNGAIELLWAQCFGRSFEAWAELALASKHSPALHERFAQLDRLFAEDVVAQFQVSFPEHFADETTALVAMRLTFAVLCGVALARIAGTPDDQLQATRDAFGLLVGTFLDSAADLPALADLLPARVDPRTPGGAAPPAPAPR